jgi:4-hydroxybenzoate polyprenyltransferase
MNRWIIYQAERFPLLKHGLLVAAFSACAVLYAAMLGGTRDRLSWPQFAAAFIVCLLFFLQLRLADEFKDVEEDTRYRPERPVPRGLVTLRELGWIFAGAAVIQLAAALWLHPRLLWVLVPAWAYLAGMSAEFGAREWLKARPITYLWTHMLIMPIVDFFATACHWLPSRGEPPVLVWFLIASFANGLVIEIGRKLRVPETEQEGVPTYSKLWGPRRAVFVWLGCVAVTMAAGFIAAVQIQQTVAAAVSFGVWMVIVALCARRFLRQPDVPSAQRFETLAGVGTLVLYLTLGPLAWFL